MAFVVSSLSDYTKANAEALAVAITMTAPTVQKIKAEANVIPDIKTSQIIGRMDTNATFQDGTACGFNASGSTTISQRTLTVGAIKVHEALCQKDLDKKFTQLALPVGTRYDTLAFAEDYTTKKIETIAYQLEVALFQGDTGSGNANLNKFDGFIKLIDADNTVINANAKIATGTVTTATNSTALTGVGTAFTAELNVGAKVYSGTTLLGTVSTITNDTAAVLAANAAAAVTAGAMNIVRLGSPFFASPITASITASNVEAIFDGIYAAIPEAVLANISQPVIFAGVDVCRLLKIALKNANRFNTKGEDVKALQPFMLPGLEVMVQPTPGLSGTGRILVMQYSNMYYGTDLLDEESKVELFYAQEAMEMRFIAEWKSGVQYGFGNQIVQYRVLA